LIILPSEAAAALSSHVLPLALLIDMGLSQPVYLNTSSLNITDGGTTWLGVGGLGRIAAIQDSPSEMKGISFELSGANDALLAAALTERVQGKPVAVRLAIFRPSDYALLHVRRIWSGRLDSMVIRDGRDSSSITVTAEHAGVDLLRTTVVTYSDSEQRRLYGNDPSLQFMADQVDIRIIWPSADFFKQ
jgi:hypothetical protein